MVRKFENLRVWREAMELVNDVYEVVAGFPLDEIYGLTSQLKRAVVSIPSNISEGCGKRTDKDFVRYLYNALGSAKEVKCQLMIALRRDFLKKEEGSKIIDSVDKLAAMLMKFIKRVRDKEDKDEV